METTFNGRRRPVGGRSTQRYEEEGARLSPPIIGSMKAGALGGIFVATLTFISLLPFNEIVCLVVPGFLVVWISVGMVGAMLASHENRTERIKRLEAIKTGALSGFWLGIVGGISGMLTAAFGATFISFGEGVLSQFTDSQLESMAHVGLMPDTIATAGSVVAALFSCGVVGLMVAVFFSTVGAVIYYRLERILG